jgi:hypothetical protein
VPVRPQPIDNEAAAFAAIADRLRKVEDAQRSRLLPPGYSFNIVDGDLVITRKADGATTTLVFA